MKRVRGRQRKAEDSCCLTIRIPKSLHEALRKFADDDYRTVAGAIKMFAQIAMKEKGYLKEEDDDAC